MVKKDEFCIVKLKYIYLYTYIYFLVAVMKYTDCGQYAGIFTKRYI